ncbi:MAG: hypothetical protein P8Y36_14430 [Alphaproteobacteria bacterium]
MKKASRKAPRGKQTRPDFLKQGVESFRAGRYFLAVEAFTKAHEAEPRNPAPLFNLGTAREHTGDIDGAAVAFTRALQLRPDWIDPAQRLIRWRRRLLAMCVHTAGWATPSNARTKALKLLMKRRAPCCCSTRIKH